MRSHIRTLAGPLVEKKRPNDQRAKRGQHPGLLLQRFLPEPATGENGNPEEKRALLTAAIESAKNSDLRALYRVAFDRWAQALPPITEAADLVTAGRLIVGLGSENVLETGIRLHHTYGLPVIPGSALKGLAAHYCNEVWGQTAGSEAYRRPTKTDDEAYRKYLKDGGLEPADNFHRLLFGTTDDSGCITFHDAWLTPDSMSNCLCQDVMTPHHPKWLDGAVPPTDFDSPIPVSFLSVAGTFRVGVSWNGPVAHDQAKNWTELAFNLLKDSLKEWGVGGKTSSGYGRLAVPPPPAPPPAPKLYEKATVTVIERRDLAGRANFKVQETGRPKPGWLQFGTPPATLPNVGDVIVVYWNNTDTNNPQYRWDVPPPPAPSRPGNRPRR